ncbi:MAG TPA: glycoside hydrolase family 38 C-terminal domain-containing protein [Terriglobia bacterium]|nr:glycoside hydrolase family 38 C-terminal domain-containing protein [Terriglobia bacterium]
MNQTAHHPLPARRATSTSFRAAAVLSLMALAMALSAFSASGQDKSAATQPMAKPAPGPDITRPTLYVVGYAHLDTEWRWEYPQAISEYLAKTMRANVDLFEKYPHYIFNFSGANRYRMMKEYFPADYEKLRHYVKTGRWFPAGSSMEENDVNSPSPESIIRQALYGNEYFRHDFGVASAEYMIPDCFGFPASLPSILAAAGVKGFSTQKLSWGSSAPAGGPGSPEQTPKGIPFNVGIWDGPDGKSVLAAFNPMTYSGTIYYDLSKSSTEFSKRPNYVDWPQRLQLDGKATGLAVDYHYYGTGDIGGSPSEPSVKLLEAIVTRGRTILPSPLDRTDLDEEQTARAKGPAIQVGDGPVRVVSSKADQMFLDILKSGQASHLLHYKGDLELTNHSAGSLTSEAQHKVWNRKNELLADAAERASVAAAWLGGPAYPTQRLTDAWTLVLGGQFHDIMAGTATPKSYEYSWNDDVIALNQFAGVLTSATAAIASGLNTQVEGAAVVVYNPLNIEREDVVEADLSFAQGAPQAVRVFGPDGEEVPSQIEGSGRVLFLAKVPSVGFAVYDVRPADTAAPASSELKVSESSLENARYRVTVDANGDVASIYDKSIKRELLAAPARLALQTEHPFDWPGWNMDWDDQRKPPRGYVSGPAQIRVVESGPVRVAVEVTRQTEGSKFVQTIRLAAGDAGNLVEFGNIIDWKTKEAALKATFPLTAANPQATYNWGLGTIERGNNDPLKFEVASHQWFDLTDKSGAYGVTVLSDCKTGSDKPDDSTLRLTLIYTPGLGGGNGHDYIDQITQDWGHHEFTYGLASHAGGWRQGNTDWQAQRLNAPLIAFESAHHAGALGKGFSFLHVDSNHVFVAAVKNAEESGEVIVRVIEMRGEPVPNLRVAFAGPVAAAREVNGQELPLGPATVENGQLEISLGAYGIRTFALKLAAPAKTLPPTHSESVDLKYDLAAASDDGIASTTGFDAAGENLPAEMLPTTLPYGGITFHLGPPWKDHANALVTRGQSIPLPAGKFNRVYILAAADGDQKGTFRLGNTSVNLNIQDWQGYIGQWNNRTWVEHKFEVPTPPEPAADDHSWQAERTRRFRAYIKEHGPIVRIEPEYTGLNPGFIKRAPVAWYASHHHTAQGGNEVYAYCYLFAYSMDIPEGATTLTLPDNEKIRIMAITVADQAGSLRPAQPLYDVLGEARQ